MTTVITSLRAELGIRSTLRRVRRGVCVECGKAFEYPYTTGRLRKYCSECQPTVLRRQKNRVLREYRRSAEGKAANMESATKYRQSSKGRTTRNKIMKEYYQTPDGRVAVDNSHTRYRQTPQGKVAVARMLSNRRERSTNPGSYIARVELLHTIHEPCAKCHTSYKISHQIDHIVALCLGGTDDWSNLQPLCVSCHRQKSGMDLSKFRELLKKDPDRFVKV